MKMAIQTVLANRKTMPRMVSKLVLLDALELDDDEPDFVSVSLLVSMVTAPPTASTIPRTLAHP